MIVGCVDYMVPGDNFSHQSGFMYEIQRNDREPIWLPIGRAANVSELRLVSGMGASSPAN